ncbi:MAG: class I SAM-dependent methyltransferase, partial [Verrucomicrobiota bacterium]
AEYAKSIKATDFNESTLEQASKKALPWDRVSLERADAYHLDTITGDFDMVMAVDWFAHVPKSRIPVFLSGITQRVPAGSQLIFIDQLPGTHSLSDHFDEEGNHIQQRSLGRKDQFSVIKHFFSNEELHEWLAPHTHELSITKFHECRRVLVYGKTKRGR